MACFLEVDPHSFVGMMRELRDPGRSLTRVIMDGALSAVCKVPSLVRPLFEGQPRSQQVMTGAIMCYGAWKVAESGYVAKALVVPKAVGYVYRWTKQRLGYYEVCYGASASSVRSVLESRRDGSIENVMTTPRCQCLIALQTEGKMVVVGCASRFENNVLVAPDHVLGGDDNVVKYAKGSQGWVSLKDKERIPLETDLVAIVLSDKEFSMIGISIAKVGALQEIGVLAQVVGPESKGTLGSLRHDALCFGRVIYSGTTVAGYSGAVYMAGSVTLGIHQMGGNVNGGYSADFVANLLRLHFKQRLEASSDWIMEQFQRSKKITWKFTGDPDTVQIKMNGKYSLVEAEDMARAFGKNWAQNNTIDHEVVDRYGDYESIPVPIAGPSGEDRRLLSLGASSELENSQGPARPTAQDVIQLYKKLSKTSRKTFHTSIALSSEQKSALNGQAKASQSQSVLA